MFLHQNTAIVYPASVTHDWTLLTWQFDSVCILHWFLSCTASNFWKCHLWQDTFNLAVILVASFIWCLACVTSVFMKILLLSLHIAAVNMSRRPVFPTYSILIRLSYIKVLLVCIMHQWVLKSDFILLCCGYGLTWQSQKRARKII